MRLAAQTKLGFYPAHPVAVEAICRHLQPTPERASMMTILDPCAGDGNALLQIAGHLKVPIGRVYAVELDRVRALKTRVLLDGAKVLGPASFLGTNITPASMSIAYVNPPFDNEIGGGRRVEFSFTENATGVIRTGGVLVLVMPYSAIKNNVEFQEYLDSWYENARLFKFPADYRHFGEVVYFGRRRPDQIPANGRGYMRQYGLHYREPNVVVGTDDAYHLVVPWSHAPGIFRKVELTDEELLDAMHDSPLVMHFDPPSVLKVKRPPLDLSTGHVSLLLASGLLNGVVRPDDEPPHVVRGNARKVDFQSVPPTKTEGDDGSATIKEVWSQKILLTVRAVASDGVIHTYEEGANHIIHEGVSR